MSDYLYNDDINLTPDSFYTTNGTSEVSDDATHKTIHEWTIDTDTSSGIPGVTPSTPEPPDEPESMVEVSITFNKRFIIHDYSTAYLLNLHNIGAKFYAVYTDGTEDECEYTDVYDLYSANTVQIALEADAITQATNQHFWYDTNGAHVTDVERDDWEDAVTDNFSDQTDNKPYHNILINSLGILLRRALLNLVSISKSAIAFYDGLGNTANNILASFGRNGVQIGANDRKHLVMNENGAAVYNADGSLATFDAQNIATDHLTIGTIQNNISDIATIRTNAGKVNDLSKTTIEALLYETKYIYISKASGTLSVSNPSAKVTETGDVQNTWTLKRPTYNPNYPVLFVGTQSVTAKGDLVFTTAIKDDTLTVIDGGHITTGTIDAARIAVNQITVGSLQDGADYATKALALNNFQQVYISKSASTTSMSAPSAWITNDADVQNQWTTTKPTYNASYPNVFISRQTKAVDNSVTSSTPYLDKSTDDAISAAASDATSKANTAKTEAISAAASDATSKANTAKSEAISVAATDATTKANAVNTALESYKTTTNTTLTNLQNQVDGQIEAWYKNVDPTTSNDPASSWNTDALKARHVGDLYYNVSNGHSWRWMQSGSSYTWQQIPDSDAAAALSVAQNAQNIANSKRRIFTTTPTVPYDIGDLWVSGSEVKYCSTSKTSQQTYASSDWTVTATDDTLAQAAKSVADAAATPTDVATAKTEAISAAASDATTKANNAKSEAISTAATNASATYATKANAVEQVQDIYISKPDSTSSVSANTTWVTATTDTYNTWTTTRPSYNASYPKIFVAQQTKKNNGTIVCTTPTVDTSTTDAISAAATDADNKYSTKDAAVTEEQYIYIQATSGTNSVNGTTTWITSTAESTSSDTANLTPIWTTKRPTYRSKYPVIFVAKQKKTVSGTVTCSTPIKDDTLTIIDGGHITTGTIDAGVVNVTNVNASNITTGTIDAGVVNVTNINASNITSGTMKAGRIESTNGDSYWNLGTGDMRLYSYNSNLKIGRVRNGTGTVDDRLDSLIEIGNGMKYKDRYGQVFELSVDSSASTSGNTTYRNSHLKLTNTQGTAGFYLNTLSLQGSVELKSDATFYIKGGADSLNNNRTRIVINNNGTNPMCDIYGATRATVTAWSDRRMKDHVEYLSDTDEAVDFIRKLKPALFAFKDGLQHAGGRHLGFYAQDVQDVEPDDWDTETVTQMADEQLDYEPLSLDYTALIAPMVATIQNLLKEVEDLKQENTELKERLEKIENYLGL